MANQFLIAGGDGLWSSAGNWSTTSGGASNGTHPVAGDVVAFNSSSGNANITVDVASACASLIMSGTYAGTLTYTSTLTLTSTYTSLSTCTIAGTAGTLILNGTATITSGGKTLTCGLTTGTGTFTLADNWTVNGLVTTAVSTINQSSSQTLTCAGGLHVNGTMTAGTAKMILTGGTWDQASGNASNSVDLQGNVTISGALTWGAAGKTLAYVSGTITTTGSTLTLSGLACTLNTAGMTWSSVTFPGAVTYTLSSAFTGSGTLSISASATFGGGGAISWTGAVTLTNAITVTLNNTGGLTTTGTLTLPNAAMTFAGSAGFTVGTLTTATLSASRTHTLTFGNTYAVTTALGNVGATATIRQGIVSSSAGNKVVFTVTVGATLTLSNCDPTDIDSSAGGQVVSTGGVITTSLNWAGSSTAGTGSPSITDVRSGVTYGAGLTGTLTLPTAAQVLIGIQFGGSGTEFTGTVTLPAVSNVRSGTTYGPSLGSTGTVTLPGVSVVRINNSYGAAGTEFTGTFVCAASDGKSF